jgi:hypothetical protein
MKESHLDSGAEESAGLEATEEPHRRCPSVITGRSAGSHTAGRAPTQISSMRPLQNEYQVPLPS